MVKVVKATGADGQPQPALLAASAVDGPHLLPAFEQPKPFVSARRLRVFSVYAVVGAASVGGVYYVLSRALAAQVRSERLIGEAGLRPGRWADGDVAAAAAPVVPAFKAPSSYAGLAERLAAAGGSAAAVAAALPPGGGRGPSGGAAGGSVVAGVRARLEEPMLHQQAALRARLAWNGSIARVQAALEDLVVGYRARRLAACKKAVAARLAAADYEVVALREVKVSKAVAA